MGGDIAAFVANTVYVDSNGTKLNGTDNGWVVTSLCTDFGMRITIVDTDTGSPASATKDFYPSEEIVAKGERILGTSYKLKTTGAEFTDCYLQLVRNSRRSRN